MESPLLATRPIAAEHRAPPVVVIGLPRSGSSFLSHVISAIDDWFVFDDLYLHRQAAAVGAQGALTADQLERLVHFLGWQLRARIKWDQDFVGLQVPLADVDRMDAALLESFASQPVTWHGLLEEWGTRLALHHGKRRWGWKAPQDFLHMRMLADLFPGVRFIFLMRDPRKTLASYKHLRGEDGSAGQYHPWVTARYWRTACDVVEATQAEAALPLLEVRYEALAADPPAEAARIAGFLEADFDGQIPEMGSNTSFRSGQRHGLTPTEEWLTDRIVGERLRELGYAPSEAKPRLRDVPDLLWTSLRFAGYQLSRLVRRPEARESVRNFLASQFRSRS